MIKTCSSSTADADTTSNKNKMEIIVNRSAENEHQDYVNTDRIGLDF